MKNSQKVSLPPDFRQWFVECGSCGGRSRSERKTKACRENIKKAQAVRWAKIGKVVTE